MPNRLHSLRENAPQVSFIEQFIAADAANPEKSASAVTVPCEYYIPLGELVDVEKEIARLSKDLKNVKAKSPAHRAS